MKEKKLAPLLALLMSFDMIFSPVIVMAQNNQNIQPKVDSNAAIANAVIGVVGSIVQQAGQGSGQLSPQAQTDMYALQRQQTPTVDKYFNIQKLSQIPGLGQYMALNKINPETLNCKTLPTTLHEAKNETCRLGVVTTNAPQNYQLNEMFTYYNQYLQVNKLYRNFSAESNSSGQLFGVGCMKNAMQVLSGFFQYRLNELDKLTTNLEALNNQFREASRSDLDAIEESTAVLNGGDSELSNKIKTKRPDLFDFSKRFENPACISIFNGQEFTDKGNAGGLNSIKRSLKEKLTTKSGKFSGESYSSAHASVVEDITNLADKAAKQLEINFTSVAGSDAGMSGILNGMRSLSSAHGITQAMGPDLFSDIQTSFQEKNNKLKAEISALNQELGTDVSKMVQDINSKSFDNDVLAIENSLKNRCVNDSAAVSTIISKIYDPTATNFANKSASNFLKDKITQIMNNSKTSPQKKLAELQALDAQNGNRYYLRMNNAYEVQEVNAQNQITTRVVSATEKRTPSVYFSDIINNCEAQFKVNKLNNQMSGAAAIQKLKSLKQSYKSLAQSQAQEMKSDIKKKLIECKSSTDANSQGANSCTPDKFNPAVAGFCANGALTCSQNMQSCNQQAEKFVSEIKTERAARVTNYKGLVQKNKQDIVKIFDTALTSYMKDGELLRGAFGVGFTSPKDIQREVQPESSRYLDIFKSATSGSDDGSLLLEDPDKYVAMFKKNVELLKESVKQQQEQILGGSGRNGTGILADHIKQTEKNYATVVKESDAMAEKCITAHDSFIKNMEQKKNQMADDQMKKNMELGEKVVEFCRRYDLARTSPAPACSGSITDLVKAAVAAGDGRSANEFSRVCHSYNNESAKSTTTGPHYSQMCNYLEKNYPDNQEAQNACKERREIKKTTDCYLASMDEDADKKDRSKSIDVCKRMENNILSIYNSLRSDKNSQDGDISISDSAPFICNANNVSDRSIPDDPFGIIKATEAIQRNPAASGASGL